MFINFWYPACAVRELDAAAPVRVKMLGSWFVLFRDGAGRAHCLADTCIHRGGALGRGRLRHGEVECPYHGWRFDGTGRCRAIPSLGPDAPIPARAKVDAYPVIERYGIVFAFLGDLAEDDRPPLMEIPEYDTPGWRANLIEFEVRCNYERSIENGLDPGHNEFVHPTHGLEGDNADYRVADLDIEETAWGFGFVTTFAGRERPEYPTRTAMRTDSAGRFDPEVQAGTWHHGPAQMVTRIRMARTNLIHQYLYECPVDEDLTRVYLVNLRNCLLDEQQDPRIIERCLTVARQDIRVLEDMAPVCTPSVASRELLVPADKVVTRYRDNLARWEANGWRIDGRRRRAAALARDEVLVIPSPARREQGNWVLRTVPLVGRDAPGAAAAG